MHISERQEKLPKYKNKSSEKKKNWQIKNTMSLHPKDFPHNLFFHNEQNFLLGQSFSNIRSY